MINGSSSTHLSHYTFVKGVILHCLYSHHKQQFPVHGFILKMDKIMQSFTCSVLEHQWLAIIPHFQTLTQQYQWRQRYVPDNRWKSALIRPGTSAYTFRHGLLHIMFVKIHFIRKQYFVLSYSLLLHTFSLLCQIYLVFFNTFGDKMA